MWALGRLMADEPNNVEPIVLSAIVKIGSRVIVGLYSLLLVAVTVAAGGGVWVTNTTNQITAIQKDLSGIRRDFVEDFQQRIRSLEQQVHVGILPNADARIERLEEHVRQLEKEK